MIHKAFSTDLSEAQHLLLYNTFCHLLLEAIKLMPWK